ncbi:hypothetical protein C2S51_014251 [Perilla frutescens var. frutescens]|nr:hypothetical protein C2S51_014251 [Perilla frutescens var. frutescens]
MGDENQESIRHSFKGKIMISSVIVLFLACFVIVSFHVYARWCRRRRPLRRLDSEFRRVISSPAAAIPQGLDLGAVNSLPTFVYESEYQESPPECAVCLSEFQGGETGRILPECNHCFHVHCIDSWLRSHRDCPLCRARVKGRPVGNPGQPDCTVVSIYVSGLSPTGIRICSPSSSSSEDPTKREGDPDGNSSRVLDQDPGFRVSRFWL